MGIEPTRPAWKAGILAIELHPQATEVIISQSKSGVNRFFKNDGVIFYGCFFAADCQWLPLQKKNDIITSIPLYYERRRTEWMYVRAIFCK